MSTITVYAHCQAHVKERWVLDLTDDIAGEWATADEDRRREIVDEITDGPEAAGSVVSVENVEVDNEEDRVWDVADVTVNS